MRQHTFRFSERQTRNFWRFSASCDVLVVFDGLGVWLDEGERGNLRVLRESVCGYMASVPLVLVLAQALFISMAPSPQHAMWSTLR